MYRYNTGSAVVNATEHMEDGIEAEDAAEHMGFVDMGELNELTSGVLTHEMTEHMKAAQANVMGTFTILMVDRACRDGQSGFEQAFLYIRYHVEIFVGDRGPVAIMSEIPSLKSAHRNEILKISRRHSAAFEEILSAGIEDGSIVKCDVRMTGNAIMGAINWIPKWFHGDKTLARKVQAEFPGVLTSGLKRND